MMASRSAAARSPMSALLIACSVVILLVVSVAAADLHEGAGTDGLQKAFYLRGQMNVGGMSAAEPHVTVVERDQFADEGVATEFEGRELAADYTPCANNKHDPTLCH